MLSSSYDGKGRSVDSGKRYPVVGSICMDQIMVIGWDEVFNGEEVVLRGLKEKIR